ncbi:MAG: MFS transporter [Chloroflexi bacterium]|nr:MFS transporter [Chloroflexota bacterium]
MPSPETQSQIRSADRPPVELPQPVRMRVLGAIMVGIFLAALDQTVVGTALPRIITDLGGTNLYTWAFTAYLLTSTISGPLYGRLSDLFGRRPLFLVGIGVFMLGSLLSGLASEMWQFVLTRGIQGLGAGALFPIAMATIADLFTFKERGRYQGLFGAVFALSSLLGPAIGGLITDTIGWPFVFFVNLPIGAVVLFTVRRYLPLYRPAGERPQIDYLGAGLFAGALVPILVGLTNKSSADWSDPSVGGLIALGGIILAAFLVVESRASEPIVPLGLFRIRAVAVSVGTAFLAASGFFTAVVFLPRWFQVVGGASATISGYEMLPLLAGVIISASAAGPIVARTGRHRRLLLISMVAMAVGIALLTQLRVDTPLPILWAEMFLTGLGVGPVFSVLPMVVQSNVPVTQIGAASSSVSFFQQVGGTVGLAITGTVFATSMAHEMPAALGSAGVPGPVAQALAETGGIQALTGVGTGAASYLASLPGDVRGLIEPLLPAILGAIHGAFSIATSSTFSIGIGTSVLAAALVLLYREAPAEAGERSWTSAEAETGEPSASAA